ncbi:MAG: response regulator [Crocinitomix sp.]|nr:response regulator [Crocinitomix sp.]
MGAILIIDDDETNNFYVKYVFSKLNITENIYFALNGQDALQIINELRNKGVSIDLILLDINMPIMNGFEFLDEYEKLPKNKESKTVITMMSSSVNSADMKKSNSYKSIDLRIEKPLNEEKMKAILQTL